MKIINKQILCRPGTVVNEDMVNMNEYGAWVLDGATGLNKKNIVHKESDAKWFVTWWDQYLSHNIHKNESISNIIEKGIKMIKSEFLTITQHQTLSNLDFPSSSIVVLKWHEGGLEYFSLGDVVLIVEQEEKIQTIMDEKVTRLDDHVFKSMKELMVKEKMNVGQAKEELMDLIISNRLLKNTEDGYWILGFDEIAAKKGLCGKIKVDKNTKVLIASDGFSALSDKYDYINRNELIKEIEKTGVEQLYHTLRYIEEKDSDGIYYPRFKKNDDASAIYLNFEKDYSC
ncbi:protein phosphatase 2C domain-containing protein [Crassaminicella profunda]|uniref:protein phosphatase 2C domain-containing protein n=1 Tax=Crassaminicella profunda TaxID=1286698 RepID=UPI001CA66687|nr:protein phosphatase 2C domain-containing protein [Crassaminicella profunda]QZY57289.1 protein phosphatase 2C domain-containing protein [Crassaminicella profunda]